MDKIRFFKDRTDCEEFFGKVAENNGYRKLTPDFIFEGNSAKHYDWIIKLASIVGYSNIGIDEKQRDDVDFVDEIFINTKKYPNSSDDTLGGAKFLDLSADEVSIDNNGIIRLWWD